MSNAKSALYHAAEIEKAAHHLESIADKLGIEDLEPGALSRNIGLYVDDYLTKLDNRVSELDRYGKL